ncbi:amidase [Streptomyces sp. N2-109]|uniref:N-acetylmuramoyl-L-alanine amidase n=1 Tax=Streptomyces gossypii TaxID=2883101 RepID=A0ABT2JMA2_9ACTN|nr:amidase [Streptomyces gossypii]MCT2589010.1 amidase [Streptomyces gossypii]
MSRRPALWRRLRSTALGGVAVAALLATVQPAGAAPAGPAGPAGPGPSAPVNRAFSQAAEEYQVPRDLLVAVGYGETRLDSHGGKPSHANGYGVMHLVSNPHHHTLERAEELTGEGAAELKQDTAANIHGGAAVLRAYADDIGLDRAERRDPAAWYPAVAAYGGARDDSTARLYADTVYRLLDQGIETRVPGGERVTAEAPDLAPERGKYADVPSLDGSGPAEAKTRSSDYPDAHWVPADSSNYSSGRSSPISAVVVHVTQGSYAGSISWFQNPSSDVSAHYLVRSSDGDITQMVRDRDTAWHARSGNAYSVGIEHEGYVDNPSWFTDAMYRSSAALTSHLCEEYGIPKDRAHVVGHSEVPGNDHTDPGSNWDWDYYMQLVGGSSDTAPELSFASYDTLREGSSGAQVNAAQYLLNQGGFDAGTVDGDFGPKTTAAVTSFQRARGLTADGTVGKRTWTALLSAGTKPVLRNGDSGAGVERLQRALTAALGRTVDADGAFGPNTEQAVRDYQTSRKLDVDGIVGNASWTALQAGK